LIDSRTGVTEVGGICSRQLADVVVAFCGPNVQNLQGTRTMVKWFKRDDLADTRQRPLDVVVVPTRVEASEVDARRYFERVFRQLNEFTPEEFKHSGVNFWDLRIPYVSKYAYAERLAVTSEDNRDELASAYHNLATHLALLERPSGKLHYALVPDGARSIAQGHRSGMVTVQEPADVASASTATVEDVAATISSVYSSLVSETRKQAPFMAPKVPSPFVRQGELEEVVAKIVPDQFDEPVARRVALCGIGGSGKTVLAAAVCRDQRVREQFVDGVVWVTLGPEPGNLTRRVEDCVVALTDLRPGITNIEAATELLSEVLSTRTVLLVVDDVWRFSHLKPFLRGGPSCVRLITTRRHSILQSDFVSIELDSVGPREAAALLGEQLPEGHEEELSTVAANLTEQAFPLHVKLASGMLRGQLNAGSTLLDASNKVRGWLDTRDLAPPDADNESEAHSSIPQTLNVSLGLLSEHVRVRYGELSIFREDLMVPLAVVEKYWNATGGLNSLETQDLCARLAQMSLLQIDRKNKDEILRERDNTPFGGDQGHAPLMIQLHPVVRDYLVRRESTGIAELHGKLLDAYRASPSGKWPDRLATEDLSAEDEYLWDNLTYHLTEAGLVRELVDTVKDVRFLASKAYARGALATEQDLLAAEALVPHDRVLAALRRTFVNAAHLLNQCESLNSVAGTLHSRIAHQPNLRGTASAAENWLPRPCVTARHVLPDQPDQSLGRTLFGHQGGVRSCAISNDGRALVSASADATVRLWDTLSGAELATFVGHEGAVTSCAISSDKTMLVSGSEDTHLKIWKAADDGGGEHITLSGHKGVVWDCDITPDKRLVVSASEDGTLKLWESSTAAARVTFTGHEAAVRGCAISSDGLVIVSASLDGTLKVWDPVSGVEIRTLSGHHAGVKDCAISADGSIAVSASRDHMVKIWDVRRGIEMRTLKGHSAGVDGCAISADGNVVASAARDNTLRVWDRARGTAIKTFAGHSDWVKGCAISADRDVVVSASEDRTLKVWDASSVPDSPIIGQHPTEMNALSLNADGTLVACASSDKTLTMWDARSGSVVRTLSGHTAPVLDCAISPTGRFIVSASSDATLRLWQLQDSTRFLTLSVHEGPVTCCAVSPDERTVVSASADRTLTIRNVGRDDLSKTVVGHRAGILACAISPNGSRIVSASDDHTLKIWDVAGGIVLRTLSGHEGWVLGCAFSPDGHRVVSASADHTLKIWDVASGDLLKTFVGHQAGVFGCAFSPDGTRVVSASGDNSLRVWHVPTEDSLATLYVDDQLSDCAWSSDNKHLMAVGHRGVYFLRLVS
jgi:WD40 repeat protein